MRILGLVHHSRVLQLHVEVLIDGMQDSGDGQVVFKLHGYLLPHQLLEVRKEQLHRGRAGGFNRDVTMLQTLESVLESVLENTTCAIAGFECIVELLEVRPKPLYGLKAKISHYASRACERLWAARPDLGISYMLHASCLYHMYVVKKRCSFAQVGEGSSKINCRY